MCVFVRRRGGRGSPRRVRSGRRTCRNPTRADLIHKTERRQCCIRRKEGGKKGERRALWACSGEDFSATGGEGGGGREEEEKVQEKSVAKPPAAPRDGMAHGWNAAHTYIFSPLSSILSIFQFGHKSSEGWGRPLSLSFPAEKKYLGDWAWQWWYRERESRKEWHRVLLLTPSVHAYTDRGRKEREKKYKKICSIARDERERATMAATMKGQQ